MTEAAIAQDDYSWIDIGESSLTSHAGALRNEATRGRNVRKDMLGVGRTWACDGEYVYFRRKQSNPATLERHNRFVSCGDYQHVETQDDVEIYELQEGSPFKRRPMNLLDLDFSNLRRQTAIAAVNRNWAVFVDGVEEIASRIKGAYHSGQAALVYSEQLEYLFHLIEMRGGPSRVEIDREVAALRTRRGETRSRQIYLPS